jgi:vacuolar-type H+-ATPase subunit H
MSTDNSAAVTTERSSQSKAISEANNVYKTALKDNSKAYPKALAANRTQWSKEIDAIRSNYYLTIDRIKASASSKMVTDATTAFNVMVAAKAKSNADYSKNKQDSLVSKKAADKAALDAKTAAIAKANAVYGAFIESIGYGVLIP